jgi:hypothetical protein
MTMKASGPAAEWREIDRWDHGVGWLAHPEEEMQRASHALEADGEVWVVDPVDAVGIDELFAEFGDVAGVVLLLDRHTRDADEIANRHGVSVHVPRWMSGVAEEVDAPVEPLHAQLGDTEYGVHQVVDLPFWQEAALYGEETGTLVVPEALGTAGFFLSGTERLGVHPMLRLFPPKKLGRLSPERILVGHGEGVLDDATDALVDALGGSRSRAPSLYAKTAREFLPV